MRRLGRSGSSGEGGGGGGRRERTLSSIRSLQAPPGPWNTEAAIKEGHQRQEEGRREGRREGHIVDFHDGDRRADCCHFRKCYRTGESRGRDQG